MVITVIVVCFFPARQPLTPHPFGAVIHSADTPLVAANNCTAVATVMSFVRGRFFTKNSAAVRRSVSVKEPNRLHCARAVNIRHKCRLLAVCLDLCYIPFAFLVCGLRCAEVLSNAPSEIAGRPSNSYLCCRYLVLAFVTTRLTRYGGLSIFGMA